MEINTCKSQENHSNLSSTRSPLSNIEDLKRQESDPEGDCSGSKQIEQYQPTNKKMPKYPEVDISSSKPSSAIKKTHYPCNKSVGEHYKPIGKNNITAMIMRNLMLRAKKILAPTFRFVLNLTLRLQNQEYQ